MNEAELVECCKRKDMTAQNELYQRYAGEMFALCIRYSGNRDFAKDLLHDGFLKAFTSLDKFFYRGEGSLKAWLSRIMVNTALEAIRKQTQHIELDIETFLRKRFFDSFRNYRTDTARYSICSHSRTNHIKKSQTCFI